MSALRISSTAASARARISSSVRSWMGCGTNTPAGSKPSARAWARAGSRNSVEATKTLDDANIVDYIRAHPFRTVVGDVRFGAEGEWAQSRVLQVQYRNISGHDVAQFRDMSTQVVVAPAEYASGEVIYPYEKAK